MPRPFGASMTDESLRAVAKKLMEKPQDTTPGLDELARAAAELLHRTIKNTDPENLDFKDVKQLTGALKDLAELLEENGGEEENGGIVIRIEGDPSQ